VPAHGAVRPRTPEIVHERAGDRPREAALELAERRLRGDRVVGEYAGELRDQALEVPLLGREALDLGAFRRELRAQVGQELLAPRLRGGQRLELRFPPRGEIRERLPLAGGLGPQAGQLLEAGGNGADRPAAVLAQVAVV